MKEFLNKIEILGLTLEAQGNDLILKGIEDKLSPNQIELIKKNAEITAFIKNNKSKLVEHLKSNNEIDDFKIKKENVSSLYELSPLQEGILFHSLYNTQSTAYKTQFSMEFSEGINMEAFRKAWEYIIKNHTILRTSFIHDKLSIPIQCVFKKTEFNYELIDYTHFEKEELETQYSALLLSERVKEFDLKKPPLMRITLVQTGTKAIRMIWTKHHILWDGWSGQILMKEFVEAYTIYSNNGVPPVREEDKFEDYIKHIKSINTEEEKSFWISYLDGFDQPSLLPFVNNRLEDQDLNENYKDVFLNFSKEITNEIIDFTREFNITVNTLLQGVWSFLLYKYSNNKDVVFGVTVSGRPPETKYEKKIGLFINTIPFRSQIDENNTIIHWLQSLQNDHVKAREFQYTSLSKIKRYNNIQHNFFDSILVFRNFPVNKSRENQANSNLAIQNYSVQENNNYPLSIQGDLREVLNIDFKFNSDIIEEKYIQMISNHFEYLILQIIGRQKNRLKEINLISDQEKIKILNDFKGEEVSCSQNITILDLINRQVQSNPNQIAVEFENLFLTYEELNHKSNQLANYLIRKGIVKGDLIGICLERSLEMIIGILGILKSGAAYVPIDADYPEERKKYILDDIAAKIVITTKKSSEKISNCVRNEVLIIDEFDYFEKELIYSPSINLDPSDLMYVIYTSGSTGKPKGVMNQHDGVLNRLLWAQDSYMLNNTDTVLQKTTYCFDVSVWELFLPLFTGAKLLFAKPEGHKDNIYLKEIIERKNVTILHFVPSMLSAFLLELSEDSCPTMKTFVCSGEALQVHHVNEFEKIFGNRNVSLQNLYGPTEAAIDVTYWNVPLKSEKVLIGKPVYNTQIYILDQQNNIQPIGVSGELCIGGIQVSRGYLNNEKLTKEKYVTNPFVKGELLYRTGDLAKWTPDGNVEYIGRKDNQVKIRGYRIELGEIETAIKEFDKIQMASVLVKSGYKDHLQLVAFIVSKDKIVIESLKDFLRHSLPSYMIPSTIIQTESFPLTNNGKLDSKKLLELYEPTTVYYEKPETIHEIQLAEIWGKLLNVIEVGRYDDFFLLGGDSILLIRMLTQIKKQFRKEIDLQKIYQYSVLKSLAGYIENQSSTKKSETGSNKIKEIDKLKNDVLAKSFSSELIEDIYPMSDIQKGMIYEYYKNQNDGVYHDQFVYMIPTVNVDTFNKSFDYLVKKHETLRTSFDISSFEGIQIVNKEISFKIVLNDITSLSRQQQEENIKVFLEEERKISFNVANAPLWRANLFKISVNKMIYAFQFHHAILDGWSLASLNSELFSLYFKLDKNENVEFEFLKMNNKLSVVDSLIDKDNTDYVDFWKNYLVKSEKLDIFSDEIVDDSYNEYFQNIDAQKLEEVSKELNTNLKTIFLGCYLYALSMLNYKKDIVIGLVSNNRPLREDGDKVLGCFLNTVPLRMQINNAWTWKDFILELQENLNGLKAKERLSLYQINKIINKNSSIENPFFDSIFNFVNFHIYEDLNIGEVLYEKNLSDEKQSIDDDFILNSFENVNTHFNFTFSITGGKTRGTFKLKRKFKSGISLQEFTENFKNILELIVNKSNLRVSNFDVISEDVKHKIIQEFNNVPTQLTSEKTLLEKFEKQVKQIPDKIAVSYDNTNITYIDLNDEANQFAHYLIEKYKIKKGDRIGIKLQRNENLLTVVLGILKSGAAYLPIDINYPQERINYIENNSKCKLIVNDKEVAIFKSIKHEFLNQNPLIDLIGSDLAYIIYTSGTTGLPKGVKINHSNVMQLINWAHEEFDSNKFEVVFASTSHCFDLSAFEMFYTLSVGKRVRILKDFLHAASYLDENKILLNTVPSSIRTILEQGFDLKNAVMINLAGEKFPIDIAQKLLSLNLEVRNLYGPTEDTTYSTCYKLLKKSYKTIPIGRPISNTKAFILDENLEIVTVGVEGYLYLSGSGLSSGYDNNEKLTEEKFITNPNFNNIRMYDTGDIVKWLPDGNIEYIGRKDNQVKLKGYRIELEEIENSILKFSDQIKQAVVIIKENIKGQDLVAYIVGLESVNKSELRQFLISQLPFYMIPNYFIELKKIPLTVNGKIDSKALPEIDSKDIIKKNYASPKTDLEKKIIAIWEGVLNIEKIGITDNFFELGGDSLLVLKSISKVQNKLKINIAPDIYFNLSTVEEMADYIESVLLLSEESEIKEYDVYDL